jgi:hypothetical protein
MQSVAHFKNIPKLGAFWRWLQGLLHSMADPRAFASSLIFAFLTLKQLNLC